jgi:tetratricopeptide (TPR) repeat protein
MVVQPQSLAPGILCGLFCLVVAPPAAAADWPVPRGPSREPAPYRYDVGRWTKVPKHLRDGPACILYSGTTHLVENDGTVETVYHQVIRLNNRQGVSELCDYLRITYDPSYQKLTLNEARVLKADGKEEPVGREFVELRDGNIKTNEVHPSKQLYLAFTGLVAGDVVEVKWTLRGKDPEGRGHFFKLKNLGDAYYPTIRQDLRIRLPRARVLKHATTGGRLKPTVSEAGGWRTYHWQASHLVPPLREAHRPPREEYHLQVRWSTFASWAEVGKWDRQISPKAWECTPEIRQIVRQETKGRKTQEEKARALTYWVRKHIRYLSRHDRDSFAAHPPARVLANRYGDCKDKSQLLAVMLREAGIAARVAGLGWPDGGQIVASVPSPNAVHAIVLATVDGEDVWIDPVLTYTAWNVLVREDSDRLCYTIDDKGAVRLERTPALTWNAKRLERTTQVTVAPDGTARCRSSWSFFGNAAADWRESLLSESHQERCRLLTEEVEEDEERFRFRRLTVDERKLHDLDQPVSVQLEYDLPGHFAGGVGSFKDGKTRHLVGVRPSHNRRQPLLLGEPFESRHRFIVRLSAVHRISSDHESAVQTASSKWGFFTARLRTSPGKPRYAEVIFYTRLEKVRVEPADFPAFRRFCTSVERIASSSLYLSATTDLKDAPALEAELARTPGDTTLARFVTQFYRNAGRLQDARRIVRSACAARPRDEEMWQLALEVAKDLEKEAAVERGKAQYRLAQFYFRADKPDRAHEALAEVRKFNTELAAVVPPAEFWDLQGQVYEKLKKPAEARKAYRQCLDANPSSRPARAACIRLAMAAKDRAAALADLRTLTAVVGADADGLAAAAELYLRLDRLDDAAELASLACKSRTHKAAQRVLGLVCLRHKEYDKAVSHLEKADLDAEGLHGLITVCLLLGKLGPAAEAAKRLGKVAAPTPELRQACALASALALRGKALLKRANPPADKAAACAAAVEHFVCAENAYREGRPAERVDQLLAAAFGRGVDLGPAYGLRGLLVLEKGRLTKALADAERALALSPDDYRGHYVRGRVRFERQAAGALADLEKAARLCRQKDGEVLHWLAAALFQAGRCQDAVALQRKAVALKPGAEELAEQLRGFEKQLAARKKG